MKARYLTLSQPLAQTKFNEAEGNCRAKNRLSEILMKLIGNDRTQHTQCWICKLPVCSS